MAGLGLALLVYAAVSFSVRRPYQTALDFRAATAPTYLALILAVVLLMLEALAPLPEIAARPFAWGYAAGAAFVAAPQVVGLARRECLHQFEVRDLYRPSLIVPRELLLVALVFPAIALCEEVVFRSALPLPKPAIALVQWLVCRASARNNPADSAIACLFLAGLHHAGDSLWAVVGAHAAIQTLTGRLRSPGLFGDVFPLLEQVRFKNLSPAWQKAAAEVAAAALLVALAR